jgi:hypothetical protein
LDCEPGADEEGEGGDEEKGAEAAEAGLDSVVDDDYAVINRVLVLDEGFLPVAYDRLLSLLGRGRCMVDLWEWARSLKERVCC